MTITSILTWAYTIKSHPDFKKSTGRIGSFAFIINNPSFDAITCLRNLGNKPDPIIIFPSAIDQHPVAIHNIQDLGSTRINPNPIPFCSPIAVTFNPSALFRKTINHLSVPKNLEDLLKLDSIERLSNSKRHSTPTSIEPPSVATAIGTRSKSTTTEPSTANPDPNPDSDEDTQEPKQDKTTIPWIDNFMPRQACLLPPTMLDIAVEIPSDPKKLFLALCSRVESLTFPTKNNHDNDSSTDSDASSDETTNLSAHELATYTYTLQYAFCFAHGSLNGASIEPCTSGPHHRRLKELTCLRLNLTDPLNPGTTGDKPSQITNPASIDFSNLQTSLDRLASTSSSKKPGFDRLSPQKKSMLLLLSSTDMISPAVHITNDLRELLSQRNNAEATEWMQTHLVNSYRVDANLTGLATAAIYAMHLCWERSDMPSNFTPFYLYRQSASDYGDNADASDNLAASLKALSGAPLSDIEAKKLTTARMMRPNTPDEALYMLRNFYRVCRMIWGKTTRISNSILDVTNHLTSNHLIYDQVTQTDPNFPSKIVFIVDQAIQQVIRSALNAKDCTDVDWMALDFGFTLRQIQTRQFNCCRPKALHHQKRSTTSPSPLSGKEPEDKQQQKKKQRRTDQDDKPKKKLAINTQDIACARIQPNEKWDAIFPKGKVPPGVPKFNGTDSECCTKYHTGGACNKADMCPRAKSHAPLDDKAASRYCHYIAECRKIASSS